MTDEELFSRLSPERAAGMLAEVRGVNRQVLRSVIGQLAARRKLRPAFIEKKPGPERLTWIAAELARPSNAPLSLEILHVWLMECRQPMLCAYLDALGIPHDEAGTLEGAPPTEPSAETVQKAVEAILAAFPPDEVAIYLRLFLRMDRAGWPALARIVESDERLLISRP